MKVEVAKYAGVCYGVERALKLAKEASEDDASVRTLGPLIHNPQAVAALKECGIEVANDLDEVPDGTIIIRSHGVPPEVIDEARSKHLNVVDATCPFVSAAQEKAADLTEEGYDVIIVGEADHPEVEGIMAHARGKAIVVEEVSDIPSKMPSRRLGIVVQTTQSLQRLTEIVNALLPQVAELRVFNTICSATGKRQRAAEELARAVDVMVVVGGHNSGNTTRLAEICRAVNERVHHVETAGELQPGWFEGAETVGVTAGASTPYEQMADVVEAIESLG